MSITGTFYTAIEIAEIYGVDFRTVLRWRRDGKLKGFRILQGYLFTQESLDEFDKIFGGRSNAGLPSKRTHETV